MPLASRFTPTVHARQDFCMSLDHLCCDNLYDICDGGTSKASQTGINDNRLLDSDTDCGRSCFVLQPTQLIVSRRNGSHHHILIQRLNGPCHKYRDRLEETTLKSLSILTQKMASSFTIEYRNTLTDVLPVRQTGGLPSKTHANSCFHRRQYGLIWFG